MSRRDYDGIYVNVQEFHRRVGHPDPRALRRPPIRWLQNRKALLREEVEELCEAIDAGDLVKVAREAVDLIYVTVGLLVGWGIPLKRCWSAVHRANMSKHRARGWAKPQKPRGWQSPDGELAKIIDQLSRP